MSSLQQTHGTSTPLQIVFRCMDDADKLRRTIVVSIGSTTEDRIVLVQNKTKCVQHATKENRNDIYHMKKDFCSEFLEMLCQDALVPDELFYTTIVVGIGKGENILYSRSIEAKDDHNLLFWIKKFLAIQENVSSHVD